MSSAGVPCLLITANVGSIFEEPSVMLKVWTEEFLSTVSRLDPKFVALHCQEVGGKNYAESMRHVEDFVRLLMSSEELRLFDKVRIFLDEDFSSAEHFTALGNLYFAHETLKDVLLWDFKESTFVPVSGQEIHSGNIESITTKEKAKFPQDFFPECKWSRKGFLRTRWSVSGTVFDLINIHLFHDASNFIAMETFPSVYSKTRRRALEHTLDRFHNDPYENAPYFLFGDFNFRTDTAGVIKKLTANTSENKTSNKGSLSKLQFRNDSDDLILTLGKKEFSHHEHQQVFVEDSGQWLREYDKELGDFEGRLFEFPINFVPSYPYEENVKEGAKYMLTRVPAWCDRVLLSPTAKSLVKDISSPDAIEYGIIGPCICMGDHKPVYLRVTLASDAGTLNCCSSPLAPGLCFRVPASYLATERLPLLSANVAAAGMAVAVAAAASSLSPLSLSLATASSSPSSPFGLLPDCRGCARLAGSSPNSSHLLHAVPLKHDPYTPDSMDSPSPNTLGAAISSESVPPDGSAEQTNSTQTSAPRQPKPGHVDRAVSPALLKSKLEMIAQRRGRRRSGSESPGSDDESPRPLRASRCSSDVSWQRSQLLTRAWLEGTNRQVYHSFSLDLQRIGHEADDGNAREEHEPGGEDDVDEGQQQLAQPLGDVVIPRIAIINASNFESNASSVHHEDCARKPGGSLGNSPASEQYLDTCYSNTRTRTFSEADSSTGHSPLSFEEDEETSKPDTEDNRVEATTLPSARKASEETQIDVAGETKPAGQPADEPRQAASATTRSNSIQSQEANVSLKLKAYNKVTERCKRNIVGKKGRCEKCCVVS